MSRYAFVTGTITNVRPLRNCTWEWCGCTTTVSMWTDQGPATLMVSPDTWVLDSETLRTGHRIAAFYDANAPMITIYPPQYSPLAAAILNTGQTAHLAYFDSTLTDEDNTLKLNIGQSTRIRTANGQIYEGPLENQILFVIYSTSTRSIPAQTTPELVVVFCGDMS